MERLFEFNKQETVGESQFEYHPPTLLALKESFEQTKTVVVGETHGVVQNYDVYRFLIEKLEITKVGIELPEKQYGFLKNIDQSSLNDPFLLLKLRAVGFQDGRINTDLLKFIVWLNQVKAKLYMFDNVGPNYRDLTEQESAAERDSVMANEIYANNQPNDKTLIIAGKHHTKIRDNSMASFLSKQSKFTSINLIYSSGQHFNFGTKEFEPTGTDEDSIRLNEVEKKFELVIPSAKSVEVDF